MTRSEQKELEVAKGEIISSIASLAFVDDSKLVNLISNTLLTAAMRLDNIGGKK